MNLLYVVDTKGISSKNIFLTIFFTIDITDLNDNSTIFHNKRLSHGKLR